MKEQLRTMVDASFRSRDNRHLENGRNAGEGTRRGNVADHLNGTTCSLYLYDVACMWHRQYIRAMAEHSEQNLAITQLLTNYADVFSVPSSLPPERQLNALIIKDKFPIPIIKDVTPPDGAWKEYVSEGDDELGLPMDERDTLIRDLDFELDEFGGEAGDRSDAAGGTTELRRKDNLVVGNDIEQKQALLVQFHSGLSKPDLAAYPGLLQPLAIPNLIWIDISMDFIKGLPLSYRKSVILVVVDRLSNYSHFIALTSQLLRCMIGEKPKEWSKWLSLAEYWHNTNFHTSILTTPYEAVYGQPPPNPIVYVQGQSFVDVVDRSLSAREATIQLLKFHLQRAQQKIKTQADKRRIDRVFEVDQCVYLKLQPHEQVTIRQGKYNKLNPKYYGPFQIIAKVGQVAYKLLMPATSQIHPVFHISLLKLYKGPFLNATATLPICNPMGELAQQPFKVLDMKLGKVCNSVVVYVLIHWSNGSAADATSKLHSDIVKRFPEFPINS
ncbi:reverse transcriptase [Tanacetum coccineum]